MRSWYLVSYDVRDEKRLRKVSRVLAGFGSRLQFSLFRCRMSERDIERLRWELSKVAEPEDALLYIGLCENCIRRLRLRDSRGEWPEDPPDWIVV